MARPLTRRNVLALGAGLALTGCGARPASEGGFVGGDGSFTTIEPGRRVAAPVLDGKTLDGTRWSATSAAGKVIVYNVWGSWCNPCRKEAPDLVKAAAEVKDQAVFCGINTRDPDPAPAQAFVRTFGVTYPNLYDPQGELLLAFSDQLPPNAIPSTLLVDPQGRLAARVVGATNATTLVQIVHDLAAGR